MRALCRYFLAPLLLAVTAFSITGPAHLAAASAHPGIRVVSSACTDGTNWDGVTRSCV
jgi:hypothetical protein